MSHLSWGFPFTLFDYQLTTYNNLCWHCFPLKQSIILKTPLSRSGSEACESCSQYQRQLAELQKQLLLTKAEKDEALKLKEEVMGRKMFCNTTTFCDWFKKEKENIVTCSHTCLFRIQMFHWFTVQDSWHALLFDSVIGFTTFNWKPLLINLQKCIQHLARIRLRSFACTWTGLQTTRYFAESLFLLFHYNWVFFLCRF